jgi:hypothetical protein
MNLLAKIGSKILSASAVLVVVLVIGCGGDDLGKRYAVSGTITYKGKPLPKGTIAFVSVKPDGRGASGVIEDGKYQMTTQSANDGAFEGSYLRKAANSVPAKYALASTSGLKAEVKASSNKIDFELTD